MARKKDKYIVESIKNPAGVTIKKLRVMDQQDLERVILKIKRWPNNTDGKEAALQFAQDELNRLQAFESKDW